MRWEELTSEEFPEAVRRSKGICLVSIGCVETHGNHIVLGCDTLDSGHCAELIGEEEDLVVFPKMYFGEKSGAGEFPGTIIFPNRLIHRILKETCYEIARNGFKKIVIINGHGGNAAMIDHVCKQFLQERPDFTVFRDRAGLGDPRFVVENPDLFPYLTEEDWQILRSYVDQGKHDGHGGFQETAMVYAGNPDWVRLENFGTKEGESNHKFDGFSAQGLYTPFGWMGNQPNSLHCNLHDGLNARIAKAILEHHLIKLRGAIRCLKEETLTQEMYEQFCNWDIYHGEEEL